MLCSQYDISRAGLHRLAVSHGWEKDRVTMAMIRARGDRITGSQVKWLCDNYATMPNSKLMLYLGIGELALARLAYKYKLKKSPEYRRQVGEKAYKMLTMMKVFAPQNEPIISSHSRVPVVPALSIRRYSATQKDAKAERQGLCRSCCPRYRLREVAAHPLGRRDNSQLQALSFSLY